MRLGKIVKEAGFRSGVGVAQDFVVVRWQSWSAQPDQWSDQELFCGGGIQRSESGCGYCRTAALRTLLPFTGLLFGHGWVRILSVIAVVMALGMHAGVDMVQRVSPLYCFTLPMGAVLFGYMLLRSMVVTLRQGGIVWRGNVLSAGGFEAWGGLMLRKDWQTLRCVSCLVRRELVARYLRAKPGLFV